MTKEEAIKRVKGYLTDYLPIDCYDEVEKIIKALKQKFITLDKIEQLREMMINKAHADADGWNTVIDLDDVLLIIDKLIKNYEVK